MSVKLLQDVLPFDEPLQAVTIRNHVFTLAERLEDALGDEHGAFIDGCPRDWGALPMPDGPLTVGIDGGYVKAQGSEQGWFEVIAGKSILAFKRDDESSAPSSKCFAFVQTYDEKPKRRLFELLHSQGLQMNQQIEFLSDGGETVRDLQLYLSPEAEHLLDWFHITMRLTTLTQTAKGLPATTSLEGRTLRDDVTGVWRILCMAQIEHKRTSAYAMVANRTRTQERISSCSSSLYTMLPSSWSLSVAYTSAFPSHNGSMSSVWPMR